MENNEKCEYCGYKIHSDRIGKLNCCNNCGIKGRCAMAPEWGEMSRINCFAWVPEVNANAVQAQTSVPVSRLPESER